MTRLNPKLVDPLLERIEKEVKNYKILSMIMVILKITMLTFYLFPLAQHDNEHDRENYLILLFFKGVCLKFKRQFSAAETCFNKILQK